MKLRERSLEFDFGRSKSAFKFDDNRTHGLSHCMKAVDFVVEWPHETWLVEVKDPDDPSATEERRKAYLDKVMDMDAYVSDLVQKVRDSYLYLQAQGIVGDDRRKLKCVVVLAFDALDAAHLLGLADRLRRQIPTLSNVPGLAKWKRSYIDDGVFLNVEMWRTQIPDVPVRRVTSPSI